MKEVKLLILAILFLFQLSCINQQTKMPEVNVERKGNPENQICGISSDTAILIAKGFFYLDYNLKEYDIAVTEEADIWKITFVRKSKECCGVSPSVMVNKIDGKIVDMINGK